MSETIAAVFFFKIFFFLRKCALLLFRNISVDVAL